MRDRERERRERNLSFSLSRHGAEAAAREGKNTFDAGKGKNSPGNISDHFLAMRLEPKSFYSTKMKY